MAPLHALRGLVPFAPRTRFEARYGTVRAAPWRKGAMCILFLSIMGYHEHFFPKSLVGQVLEQLDALILDIVHLARGSQCAMALPLAVGSVKHYQPRMKHSNHSLQGLVHAQFVFLLDDIQSNKRELWQNLQRNTDVQATRKQTQVQIHGDLSVKHIPAAER